jgi:hypothetical protein
MTASLDIDLADGCFYSDGRAREAYCCTRQTNRPSVTAMGWL